MQLRTSCLLTLLVASVACGELGAPADDLPSTVPPPGPSAPELDSDGPTPARPTDGTLRQIAKLKATDGRPGDNFGLAVALSAQGGTLAVSALREDGSSGGIDGDRLALGAPDSGAVYVYRRTTQGFDEEAYIKPTHPDPRDAFGFSLAISDDGTTLAVGALREDGADPGVDGNQRSNTANDSGAVFVFVRTTQGWTQQAYLKAEHVRPDDAFGWSVALSADGDTLAVGTLRESSGGRGTGATAGQGHAENSGAVYTYRRRDGAWEPQSFLKASNADPGDLFGLAVDLSADGRLLAVSAGNEASGLPHDPADNSSPGSGAVYLWADPDGTGAWDQVAWLKAGNVDRGANYGTSVDLSPDGQTLAVGAIGEATGPDRAADPDLRYVNAGAVYVYRSLGWPGRKPHFLKPEVVRLNTNFGRSVALTDDAGLLAIGASWEHSDATGIDGDATREGAGFSGAAYLFSDSEGSWAQRSYIKPSNTAPHQNFGVNVSITSTGDLLAVGASGEASAPDGSGDAAPKSGAVYLFSR